MVKLLLLGEAFRQVLTILPRGSLEAFIEIGIKNSPLWPISIQYRLNQNMTTADQREFAVCVLHLGNGTSAASQDPNLAVDDIEVSQVSCNDVSGGYLQQYICREGAEEFFCQISQTAS